MGIRRYPISSETIPVSLLPLVFPCLWMKRPICHQAIHSLLSQKSLAFLFLPRKTPEFRTFSQFFFQKRQKRRFRWNGSVPLPFFFKSPQTHSFHPFRFPKGKVHSLTDTCGQKDFLGSGLNSWTELIFKSLFVRLLDVLLIWSEKGICDETENGKRKQSDFVEPLVDQYVK